MGNNKKLYNDEYYNSQDLSSCTVRSPRTISTDFNNNNEYQNNSSSQEISSESLTPPSLKNDDQQWETTPSPFELPIKLKVNNDFFLRQYTAQTTDELLELLK